MALLLLISCQSAPPLEIVFGGDIILAREGETIMDGLAWSGGGLFPAQEDSKTERLFFANLESPLSKNLFLNTDQGFNLCANAMEVESLKAGALDLVSVANNHREDCGQTPTTVAILAEFGILAASSVDTPIFLDTQAGKVGVLAANLVGESLPLQDLLAHIATARGQCHILIVSLHWGFEYTVEPTATQREWAQALADAGVDVLWGHHPHVLQPIEWVSASRGGHQMLAMYSLGNLITDQWMTWETQHSALITVQFTSSGIAKVVPQPVQMEQGSRWLIIPSVESREKILERIGLQ